MSNKGFTYTLQIDAEINDLLAKTAQVKKSLQSAMEAGKATGADKIFGSVEKSLEKLQQRASQPITSLAEFEKMQKESVAVAAQLEKLGGVIQNLSNLSDKEKLELLPSDFQQRIANAQKAVINFANSFEAAQTESKELQKAQKDLITAQNELARANQKVVGAQDQVKANKEAAKQAREKVKAIKEQIDALQKYKDTYQAYEKSGADKRVSGSHANNASIKDVKGKNLPADRAAVKSLGIEVDTKSMEAVEAKIAELSAEYASAGKAVTAADNAIIKSETTLRTLTTSAETAQKKVSGLEDSVDTLNKEFEDNKVKDVQAAYAQLRTEAGKLGVDLSNIPLDYTEQNLEEVTDALQRLKQDGLEQANLDIQNLGQQMEDLGTSTDTLSGHMATAGQAVVELDQRVANTTAFTQRLAQFVGLQGGIELARRAMRDAMNTIKDLDAAMTEMAVVTDLGVGDYWSQLPEYTKRANELGVSIKAAYESATLYYQQGLKTNEVVAMSNQTLKMARIAGLSAEDATNKMTAALRGFNMELNETSAQKVADVYSELAAITASDVNEISSAMTKTASIAASAGMQFETTAAFLSQIIETTRESAETAGTALKTVIARFQELKKDPAEIGEVDGEVVDANKIETALRSVGVALRDTSGQFRDLDEVFLELSSKWDGLDTNTQRYIATIAAGSRQQSRFIAMMSDYARTQDLVTAANNSAGASNKQFEKTMDSLESKLNELKNAWDSFTMGIMNSEVLKAGVDILTALISSFNKFTEMFGKFSGVAKIGVLILAFKLADNALKTFSASLRTSGSIFTSFGAISSSALNRIKADFLSLRKIITKKKDNTVFVTYGPAIKATEDYRKAVLKAQSAENIKSTATKSAQKDTFLLANAEKMAAEAQEEQTNAVIKYSAAQGVSKAVAQEALGLQLLGVGAEEAEKAALGGLTTAKYKELQATMIANGLSPETVKQRMAEIIAIYAQKGAEEAELGTTKKGVLWKTKAYLALLFGNKEKRKAAMVSLGLATAEQVEKMSTEGATVAQNGLNAAMLANPIGLIIALIAALVVALAGLIVWLVKTQSAQAKLNEAKKAAEAASKAADETAESYKNLSDSLDGLTNKYDNLEELTKGTKEWKDSVREINGEVMDLIDKYPELAKYAKNIDGVLTIDTDSEQVQAVLQEYEDRAIAAQSAELAAKVSVGQAQNRVDYKNLKDRATVGSEFGIVMQKIGGVVAGTVAAAIPGVGPAIGAAISTSIWENANEKRDDNKKQTENLAQAMADGLIVKGENGVWQAVEGSEEALEKLGLAGGKAEDLANQLGKGADELAKYGEQVKLRKEQEEAMYETMAQNAASMVDTSKMSEEKIKQIQTAADASYVKIFEQKARDSFNENTNAEQKDLLKDYAEGLGYKNVKVKDNKVIYEDAEGEKEISREEFEKQYIAAKGTEEAAKQLAKLPDAIKAITNKVGEDSAAFANAYMAKEGGALTREQANQLAQYSDAELENLYNSLEDEEKAAFGSIEEFRDHIQESAKLANQAFDTATAKLAEMGGAVELNGKMTADSAKGYTDQLELIMSAANQEGINAVNSALNAIGESLTESDFNKFMGQINAMDWKNMDDWENLPELLNTIDLDVTNKELETFIKEASNAAGAIKKIDLEKLRENLLGLEGMKSKLKSGEQGRVFSEADYKMLIEADKTLASQFQQNFEGEYVYLGSSMATLTQAIEANTAALLGESVVQLQEKIDAAKILDWLTLGDGKQQIWNYKDMNEKQKAYFLNDFIKNSSHIDLKQLNIKGLSNNTEADKLSEEVLDSILGELLSVYNSNGDNIEKLAGRLVSDLTLTYMNDNIATNSTIASEYRKKINDGGQLTEQEQAELTARTNAITTQAVSAGVNTTDIRNYTAVIERLKKLQEQFEKNEIEAGEFATQYSEISKEAERFERKIVNKTNLAKLNQKLASSVEQLGDLGEQFDNTADEATKMEIAAKMVENFGVQVDETNYEHVANLAKTVAEGGEAGFAAMQELLNMAGTQYGLTLGNMEALTTTSTDQMAEEMVTFAELMVSLGMGMFQEMENGLTHFVWATRENLDTAIGPKEQKEDWESSYDYLYAKNEETNRLIREREKAERRYQRAVNDSSKSAEDLLEITKEELGALKEQADLQGAIALKAQQSIKTAFDRNEEFANYVAYDTRTNTIRLDTQGLANVGWDEETGSRFEEFLASIEENRDVILEAEETLNDIEDQVEEIENRGREEASSLYDAIKEGIIAERQEEIDKLSEINDSINDAQSKLVDQIQKQIDEERQARQNEETEQNIADKAARLAYLKRDTSGANAAAIKALEKELRQDKQAYSDTLIDQKLQQIQDANEKASEQRQQQIELMQAQLDAYSTSEQVWQDVEVIIKESLAQANASDDFTKTFLNNTLAGYYGKIGASFNELNPIAQKIWAEGFGDDGKIAGLYLGNNSLAELIGGENGVKAAISEAQDSIGALAREVQTLGNTKIAEGVSAITKAINNLPGEIAKLIGGKSSGSSGGSGGGNEDDYIKEEVRLLFNDYVQEGKETNRELADIYNDFLAQIAEKGISKEYLVGYTLDAFTKQVNRPPAEAPKTEDGTSTEPSPEKQKVINLINKYINYGRDSDKSSTTLSTFYGNLQQAIRDSNLMTEFSKSGFNYRVFEAYVHGTSMYAYKNGGLADFTGPAWLDGTKSKPEMVLDAQDTQNFIVLRDVLQDILAENDGTKGASGDNYFDIAINVDNISDDYSVEQLADKIRAMLYEDATYRNVNAVTLIR